MVRWILLVLTVCNLIDVIWLYLVTLKLEERLNTLEIETIQKLAKKKDIEDERRDL